MVVPTIELELPADRSTSIQNTIVSRLDYLRIDLFAASLNTEGPLKRHDTLFGNLRTEQEMAKLAARCGWRTEFSQMPRAFYGVHYRFDATVVP